MKFISIIALFFALISSSYAGDISIAKQSLLNQLLRNIYMIENSYLPLVSSPVNHENLCWYVNSHSAEFDNILQTVSDLYEVMKAKGIDDSNLQALSTDISNKSVESTFFCSKIHTAHYKNRELLEENIRALKSYFEELQNYVKSECEGNCK